MHPRFSDRELMNIGALQPKGKTAYVITPAAGETTPALSWQTQPNGVQYLTARFSIPRQRWGHNARLPASHTDIFAGLGIASNAIYQSTGVEFNPLTANVTDVHYAMDIHVGSSRIRPILDRLELRQLPKHTRIRLDNGVEFKQKQASTQIYGKYIEVKAQSMKGHIQPKYVNDALEAADGILRVEHRLTLPAVQRTQERLGISRQAVDVLTPEASHRMIAQTLEILRFTDAIENAATDDVLDRLVEFHGVPIAMRLYGFLKMVRSYGPDFWKFKNLSRRTFYSNLKQCKAAGVWSVDK